MDYAIIKLGNKQHRVRDGETLIVDRLPTDEGKTFEPVVLLGDTTVTAKVLTHGRGPKLLIGKYRRRTGYKRHNGFRAATTQVEITLGAGGARRAAAKSSAAKATPKEAAVEAAAVETPAVEAVETPAVEAAVAETSAVVTPAVVTPAVEAEVVEVATATDAAGLPDGYDGLTVAQVTAGAKTWSHAELEAAVAYEEAHAARKGALTALQTALAKEAGA